MLTDKYRLCDALMSIRLICVFQVGDGTFTDFRLTPVDVVSLGGHVVSLELGGVRLSPLPKHRHGLDFFPVLIHNTVSFVRFVS